MESGYGNCDHSMPVAACYLLMSSRRRLDYAQKNPIETNCVPHGPVFFVHWNVKKQKNLLKA